MTQPHPEWTTRLLGWYDTVKRDFPWRQDTDPYRVWVSEIMLQQTRIEAAMGYYRRFMQALPKVADLAAVGMKASPSAACARGTGRGGLGEK